MKRINLIYDVENNKVAINLPLGNSSESFNLDEAKEIHNWLGETIQKIKKQLPKKELQKLVDMFGKEAIFGLCKEILKK